MTVTMVKIDRELQYANVYVSAMGDESRQDEVMAGLENAKGFLRHELAQRMSLRTVPALIFHWDFTQLYAERVNAILDGLESPPEDEVTNEAEQSEREEE